MIEASRRKFFGGLIGLVAAPAVIRVADLMKIKPAPMAEPFVLTGFEGQIPIGQISEVGIALNGNGTFSYGGFGSEVIVRGETIVGFALTNSGSGYTPTPLISFRDEA